MYQVWKFIAPGLYAREKRMAVPFAALATAGTVGAVAFTHFLMFPAMMAFFARFGSRRLQFLPRLEDTFDLYLNLLLGMIVVFQIPTLALFLARLRMITARFLWRNFKYAILIAFIVAAVLTPSPDPWNQTAFAAPMLALYLLSIGIAWLAQPNKDGEAGDPPRLQLVVAATVFEQARRRRRVISSPVQEGR
jgi:sec-independent protein translocase protein TatC